MARYRDDTHDPIGLSWVPATTDDQPPVNWMWPLPKGGADPICPWCETRHSPTCAGNERRTIAHQSALLSEQLHLFAEDAIAHAPPWLRPPLRGCQLLWQRFSRWTSSHR